MRLRLAIPCAAVCVISLAIFGAGLIRRTSGATAAPSPTTEPGVLVIRKATYGDLPDGNALDVTAKVRSMVKDGVLSVAATDENFGDPFNGKLKLTIRSADARVPGINLGGDGGAGDITDRVKQFQNGNVFHMKIDGDMRVTIHYDYGDGKQRTAHSLRDGSIDINPPTKLRVDYTAANGEDASKVADRGQALRISANDPVQRPVNVAGTAWGVDYEDKHMDIRFHADGTLDFSDGNDTGTWKQDGAWIQMEMNHYATYRGTISGDRMEGSASNVDGKDWDWSGRLASGRPTTTVAR